MDARTPPRSLSAARADARRLLKQFRSADEAVARPAADRLLRIRTLRGRTAPELLSGRDAVQLKHALAAVAEEHGFSSWIALQNALSGGAELYTPRMGGFLNRWFRSYDDARSSLGRNGGYLFPYRHQFFVCEADAVRELGLDPADPDWERIGFDWVRPADAQAHRRLMDKRRHAMRAPEP